MITLGKPTVSSQTKALTNKELTAGPTELPKILFEFAGRAAEDETGNEVPTRPIELNRETERYMKFRLKQVSVGFDAENNKIQTEKFYKMERCTEEFFASDETQRNFWN